MFCCWQLSLHRVVEHSDNDNLVLEDLVLVTLTARFIVIVYDFNNVIFLFIKCYYLDFLPHDFLVHQHPNLKFVGFQNRAIFIINEPLLINHWLLLIKCIFKQISACFLTTMICFLCYLLHVHCTCISRGESKKDLSSSLLIYT